MRVLAVTNLFPSPSAPHRASFNRQQFAALAKRHELRVIAPVPWPEALAAPAGSLAGERDEGGVSVEHPTYFFTPKVLRGWYGHFYEQSVRATFVDAVRRFQPDVVLAAWAYPDGWAAARLARSAGIPCAIKVHGSDLHRLRPHSARERRTREAFASADAVIAVSEELGARCARLGADPHRVHVVRNGVDCARFAPGCRDDARRELALPSDRRLVLAVGNLLPVKGFDVLIEACARAKARGGELHVAIVGEGPERPRLERSVRAGGLDVRFVGQQPHAALPRWMQAADCVVLPSRGEGVPNVLLEATACGVPWIASDVGGVREIAAGNTLVPAEDPDALASALLAAINGTPATGGPRPGRSWEDSALELAEALQAAIAARSRKARAA